MARSVAARAAHPPPALHRGLRSWLPVSLLAAPLLALLLALTLTLPFAAAAQEAAEPGRRMALVVGNGAYDSLPVLPNAVGDARALAEQLRALDFDVVLLTDIDLASFDVVLDGFATRAAGAEAVLFYFSGHAVQMAGANWLAPREAMLHDPGSIAAQMIRLDAVIARIAAPGRQTIVLLDACRNDPRPAALRETLPEGLAPLQAGLQGGPETGRDLFVAFATQPGNTASDGPPGGHSQFTEALLDHLPLTGQPIAEMMIGVRNQVSARTLGRQVPWDQSSLTAPFFFAPLVLGEADYDLLAGMGPAQREWTLAIWRSQGARIDMEDVTRRMAALEGPGDIGQGTEAETGRDPDTGPSDAGPSEIELAAAETPTETTAETPAPEARTIAPLPAPTASLAPLPPRVAAIEVNPEAPAETTTETPAETLPETVPEALPETPPVEPAPATVPQTPQAQAPQELSAETPAEAPTETPAETPAEPPAQAAPETATEAPAIPADLPRAVQQELARLGCYRLRVDGLWGPGSRRALDAFERQAGVSLPEDATGTEPGTEPGAEVWLALRAVTEPVCAPPAAPAAAPPDPAPDAAAPQAGPDLIRAVQQELARLGCYRLRVSGIWGRGSQGALDAFSRRSGVRLSGGQPSPALLQRLRAIRQPVCPAPQATAAAQPPAQQPAQPSAQPSAQPPRASGLHGAIAFARSGSGRGGGTLGWGVSWRQGSAQAAASRALQQCRGSGAGSCQVVLSLSGECGAIAAGGRGHGAGRGASVAAAQSAAMAACRRQSSGCRLLASTCSASATQP